MAVGRLRVAGRSELFDGLFFDTKRYDLSPVGRLKINKRLGLDTPLTTKVLTDGDSGCVNVSAAPSVPSVLVEPFFGSSEQECRLAKERIEAYAGGLIEAFELFMASRS